MLKQSVLTLTVLHLNSTKYNHNPNIQGFVTFFISCARRPPHKTYHENKSWVLVVAWAFLGIFLWGWCGVCFGGRGEGGICFLKTQDTKGTIFNNTFLIILSNALEHQDINRTRTLMDMKNPAKSGRNMGKIPCVHIAGRYWREASSKGGQTYLRHQYGARRGPSPHRHTPSPSLGYLNPAGSLQPSPGSQHEGRGSVSRVPPFCRLLSHPSYGHL